MIVTLGVRKSRATEQGEGRIDVAVSHGLDVFPGGGFSILLQKWGNTGWVFYILMGLFVEGSTILVLTNLIVQWRFICFR